jgi:hypothetical protein
MIATFGLSLAVARQDGRPVVPPRWLRRQVELANAMFRPQGVDFVVDGRRALPERYARLESRGDRHDLGRFLRPEVINVFVVDSLRDVDEPERMRQGVHWRPRRALPEGFVECGPATRERCAHLVIVSRIAGEYVLAHELGHFFGNRHSPTPGNLMSYEDAPGPPFFDGDQRRRIRRSARRFLRTGELLPR